MKSNQISGDIRAYHVILDCCPRDHGGAGVRGSDSGNDRDEKHGLPMWKTSELVFLFYGLDPSMKETASVNTTSS